jgi:hypothetical protein
MSQDLPKGRDPSSPAPKAPQGNSSKGKHFKAIGEGGLSGDLARTALELYRAGYNVVLVGPDKKPLTSWGSRERIPLEELEKLLGRATGVAIAGGRAGYWGDVAYVMLVDIDDPSILDRAPKLRELVESTVSWKTGPRCPRCYNKHLTVIEYGKRFRCDGEHGGKRVGCGLEFTVEEAARGLGALVLADIDAVDKLLKGGTVRLGSVELLINNYQLIPPSLHPTCVRYEWIRKPDLGLPNHGLASVGEELLRELLEELKKISRGSEAKAKMEANAKVGTPPRARLRELSDSDVLEIKEALTEAYKPGVRQFIWLFLSGWAAKAGISPISVARVLKMLYESSGDTDSLKTRASAIVYSYKKAGVDLEPYARELEELLGVKPYGLEGELEEEEVKGVSGLQEVLERVVGEERALEIVRLIADKFGVASPYRDSIVEILDYERQIYAVANLRRLTVVRAVRRDGRLVYRERIVVGAPTEVTVYVNPVGGVTKYQVRWEAATRPKPLIIGPALLEEVVDRLRAEGLVLNSRLVGDTVAAVIEGFIRRGRAEIKVELEVPGFYLVDGGITAVGFETRRPSMDELKESLKLLNELAEVWFKHVIDKFSGVLRFGVIAPFIYIYKQGGTWVRWEYLYGPTRTGKSTLAEIATVYMWGLELSKHVKSGASVDTPARLGHVLSQSTFPVIINEPGGALSNEAVVEMIKQAVEKTIARGKYHRGTYIDIPALAPLIFTSNRYLPRDDALLRRFKVRRFTYGDRIPEDKAKEFEVKVKPRLSKLRALGGFVASYVVENGLGEDPEETARKILEEAYKTAGLQVPEWVNLEDSEEAEGEAYESVRELIRGYILERVNEEYSKFVGRVVVERPSGDRVAYQRWEVNLEERLRTVLEYHLIPWLLHRGEEVYITTGLVEELKDVIGDVGGLKSLAELLGWAYDVRKVGGRPLRVAITSLRKLLELLSPEVD